MSEHQLVVVLAPETPEEASRVFSSLLAGGFHPTIDYGPEGLAGKLANYPVLVPQQELGEAKGFLRGLKARPAAPAAAAPSMFDPGLSDRPVGPIPPWKFSETVGKAVGVLIAMLVLVGGIVALVKMLQFLSSLRGH